MPCLNRTLDVSIGEQIIVRPADLHSDITGFADNTSRIVAGRTGRSAQETAVSPSAITIAARASGVTRFSIRMADDSLCTLSLNVESVRNDGFRCPVPAPTIQHQLQSGALCVPWTALGLPDNARLLRPVLSPPVSFSFSATQAECAIRIEHRAIDRFSAGEQITINYSVVLNGQSTRCQASVQLMAARSSGPRIDQCSNGAVNLESGVPFLLSVSNASTPVSIRWYSDDSALTFSEPDRESTLVTANAAGRYTIRVECCFDDLS